jgi:hypothetical protein
MDEISKEILICLSVAHFLGDFFFQPDADASRKRRPLKLFKHTFIVAALGYLLCGIWDLWQIPLVIFLTHGLMDSIKTRLEKESAYSFILDQAVHLALIIAIIIVVTKIIPISKPSTLWVGLLGKGFLKFLILIAGLVVCIKAGGILIGLAVKPFTDELQKDQERTKANEASVSRGFENGGKIIGYLERVLIFLFILTGQPGSIGF